MFAAAGKQVAAFDDSWKHCRAGPEAGTTKCDRKATWFPGGGF